MLILRVPMGWHKMSLGLQVVWIGWSICLDTWTVNILQAKLEAIASQGHLLLTKKKVLLKDFHAISCWTLMMAHQCLASPPSATDSFIQGLGAYPPVNGRCQS